MAAAKPVNAGLTAVATVGTFQALRWLKKNHPKRASAFGVPLSAWVTFFGLGGGIYAMVSKNKALEPFADYLVAAGSGAACHVPEDIEKLDGGAAGAWESEVSL